MLEVEVEAMLVVLGFLAVAAAAEELEAMLVILRSLAVAAVEDVEAMLVEAVEGVETMLAVLGSLEVVAVVAKSADEPLVATEHKTFILNKVEASLGKLNSRTTVQIHSH